MVHELSRRDARRIAVRAQLLDASRPTSLIEVVRRLTFLQVDLTAAVAPSADLVCWSRLGARHAPRDLDTLLDQGDLVEFQGLIRPGEDMALYVDEMQRTARREGIKEWQHEVLDWFETNDVCRADILDVLRNQGPTRARDLPDTCVIPWRSSGWNDNKNVQRMLDIMERLGDVAVASRQGRERLWDLTERVFPDLEPVPHEQARRTRDERRLASLGLARARAPQSPGDPLDVGEAGEPAVIDGVRGSWRVDPAQLGQPFRGRTALLSPLDRLVFDRRRLADIFGFDYQLEMYKPASRRRWGYWALPVLHGDRLVGKLDATADHRAGILRVHTFHEDVELSATARAAVDEEVADLASWLGLELVRE
jgi:uncharacterized protein